MKIYLVTVGDYFYTMCAPNIQAASQFVRHWPNVVIRPIRTMQ